MQILHGTWVPQSSIEFFNPGQFVIWIESTEHAENHLKSKELATFFDDLPFIKNLPGYVDFTHKQYAFLLPTVVGRPIPSPHALALEGKAMPEEYSFDYHPITCYTIRAPLQGLKELQFALLQKKDILLGEDFIFWRHFMDLVKIGVVKDHYIPSMRVQERVNHEVKTTKKTAKQIQTPQKQYQGHASWQLISSVFEEHLPSFIENMPTICAAGRTLQEAREAKPALHDKTQLLRHAAGCIITEAIQAISLPENIHSISRKSALENLFSPYNPNRALTFRSQDTLYQNICDWQQWQHKLQDVHHSEEFILAFRLSSPLRDSDILDIEQDRANDWTLNFLLVSKKDPSFQMTVKEYWKSKHKKEKQLSTYFGSQIERNVLLMLGYAAQIYPEIWQALDSTEFDALNLTTAEAFLFLKEHSWVLQDAGFKILFPAWYTPDGRRKARLKVKAKHKKGGSGGKGKSYFSTETLVDYRYQLALGDQPITPKEWEQLVSSKSSLVYFRGEWVQIDQNEMASMLKMWQNQKDTDAQETSLLDFMRLSAQAGDNIAFDYDDVFYEILQGLQGKKEFTTLEQPQGLQAVLREYQKRGMSWILYLQSLGLNGCLADDMGLGKTIQVIASLLHEQQQPQTQKLPPTLLIVPTSVVPNWQREIMRFAPQIKIAVHTGSSRVKEAKEFKDFIAEANVVITSYAILRRDQTLFEQTHWYRIVLDEAQNIKNPETAQTKLIFKLKSSYRIALTGTPVENRLMDLWSIFHFLNPGYLGKHTTFRKEFELPIQKENNPEQAAVLRKMVEPFILRRLKSDKSIISDLPEKIETKVYTHLSKEQASLYQAVVKDVEEQLEDIEGIQRKGLILSTLMKLKQICNHPVQFLQDKSEFTIERSQKLQRLVELIQEVLDEGNSILIFSQFQEIVVQMDKLLKEHLKVPLYLLHGGTKAKERDRMIQAFQDPETAPSIFLLSLKAGGVGITLTKASHVFHFDRWWNPAVEDQASDRAYRIGQKKTVFVHKFVTEGTLEERIDEMIEDKKRLAGSIIGGDEGWLTELDNEAFKKLIQLNRSVAIGE